MRQHIFNILYYFLIVTDRSSKEDITSHLNFLIAKSVEMNQWHEASVVEMRENRRVVVFKKLLIAGDVELNPGPYPPGTFIIQC